MSLSTCVGHEDLTFFKQMNELAGAHTKAQCGEELDPISLLVCLQGQESAWSLQCQAVLNFSFVNLASTA